MFRKGFIDPPVILPHNCTGTKWQNNADIKITAKNYHSTVVNNHVGETGIAELIRVDEIDDEKQGGE